MYASCIMRNASSPLPLGTSLEVYGGGSEVQGEVQMEVNASSPLPLGTSLEVYGGGSEVQEEVQMEV